MEYLKLKKNCIDLLRKNENFSLGLQLGRLLNLIIANHRQFIRIKTKENSKNKRDQIETILYHGAVIYESLKTIKHKSKIFSNLPAWTNKKEIVQRIQREIHEKRSFSNVCLKVIRDKIIFHYELSIIEGMLNLIPLNQETIFAEYGEGRLDYNFLLSDDILLHFMLAQLDDDDPEIEVWNKFQEMLFDLSEDLAKLLFELVLDLVGDFVEVVKVPT